MRWLALAVLGIVALVAAAVISYAPVHASVPGNSSFVCGRPIRKLLGNSAQRDNWVRASARIRRTHQNVNSSQLPTKVCPRKENNRLVPAFVAGIVGVLALLGAGFLFWRGSADAQA